MQRGALHSARTGAVRPPAGIRPPLSVGSSARAGHLPDARKADPAEVPRNVELASGARHRGVSAHRAARLNRFAPLAAKVGTGPVDRAVAANQIGGGGLMTEPVARTVVVKCGGV